MVLTLALLGLILAGCEQKSEPPAQAGAQGPQGPAGPIVGGLLAKMPLEASRLSAVVVAIAPPQKVSLGHWRGTHH
jgi:hypothetical protein